MKVYQINVVCGSGSTGRIAVDLSNAITTAGGKCKIAYGRGQAPLDVDSIKISNRLDLYYHVMMTRLTDRHGLFSKHATRKLIVDIQAYSPDIIHLHNIHGYYVNYEMLFRFLKEYNKPVIWTMHDCWAFTGHCAHYEEVGCNKWKMQCDSTCCNWREYPSTRTARNVSDNYIRKKASFLSLENLTIVTPSKWLASQLENSFFTSGKIVTIANGINLNYFKPCTNDIKKKLNCERKKLILGVASVWNKKKGLDDFLKLAQLLDEAYQICLVGLNRKQLKTLPEGIIGIEKTNSIEELAQYYSASDVFLNLTYEDTFPTTNIEALACGTPVITYQTGGSGEMLNNACGVVVEKGNIKLIKMQVEKMHKRENTDEICRLQAMKYDKEVCYTKYIELYKEII